jgi:hypothetical protein
MAWWTGGALKSRGWSDGLFNGPFSFVFIINILLKSVFFFFFSPSRSLKSQELAGPEL